MRCITCRALLYGSARLKVPAWDPWKVVVWYIIDLNGCGNRRINAK
jgi:hypothetical protein